MKPHAMILAALLGLIAASAVQAETASTLRSTALQAEPQSDGRLVITLPADTRLEVLARKGAWVQVRNTSGQAGWVHMANLQSASAPPDEKGAGAIKGLMSSGRTSNTAIVTTGVRGLPGKDAQDGQESGNQNQPFAQPVHGDVFSSGSKLAPLQIGRPVE